ncbi:MAG TPA: nitroreductase family deazaflavin-dependent oxidoreductase [Dehalococcoidia bacterium]|nr:nitroreductase family deazaflavin-dependent oxidoreductase [Dehalococcoidia bacterium]
MTNERNERNRQVIEEFRANGGNVAQFKGIPLLLLHHKGAKSGKLYINPLAYLPEGDSMVIFASMGGAPTSPDWYHNLVANPNVQVELGDGKTINAKARVAQGEEHDWLYQAQVARVPVFDDYRKRTTRVIPVVVLERT